MVPALKLGLVRPACNLARYWLAFFLRAGLADSFGSPPLVLISAK
jgi:hypothetical protein